MQISETFVRLTVASLRTFVESAGRFGAHDDAVVRVSHKRKGGDMTTLTINWVEPTEAPEDEAESA